jgi:hypothetical protein
MIFGADTGFLVGLIEDNPAVLESWRRVLNGQDQMILSVSDFRVAERQKIIKLQLLK